MNCFVNLPLRYIESQPNYLKLFLNNRLCPELGLDAMALELFSVDWHRRTADIFHNSELRCAVHLPFFDLHPGSLDPWAREVCERRLSLALAVGKIYEPAHFIAHLDYNPLVYAQHEELWLRNSLETWTSVLEHAEEVPVFLENVHELSPKYQCMVLGELGGKAKACFDIGHWHSFGRGKERGNLTEWMDGLAPYLGHLHLHDNDGSGDQHLGLGLGEIPWNLFGTLLKKMPCHVTATLEPHTEEDFRATHEFLREHSALFPC